MNTIMEHTLHALHLAYRQNKCCVCVVCNGVGVPWRLSHGTLPYVSQHQGLGGLPLFSQQVRVFHPLPGVWPQRLLA